MEYKQIDWERPFSTAYGVVRIPANLIFYRGYDTSYPSVSAKPAYYSGKEIAKKYAEKNKRILGIFTNTRELKLLDIRFMKALLKELFDKNKSDNTSLAVTLSFGLSSLYHQIRLAKIRYSKADLPGLKALQASYKESLYEQPGVRIAETTNDAETMGFLSTIFNGFVDGFISPRLYSPFHVEKGGTMSPELIIFRPESSFIQQLQRIPKEFTTTSFDEIFTSQFGKTVTMDFHIVQQKGGYKKEQKGADILPSIERIHEYDSLFQKGVRAGEKWKQKNTFCEVEGPVPTVKVNPWV